MDQNVCFQNITEPMPWRIKSVLKAKKLKIHLLYTVYVPNVNIKHHLMIFFPNIKDINIYQQTQIIQTIKITAPACLD